MVKGGGSFHAADNNPDPEQISANITTCAEAGIKLAPLSSELDNHRRTTEIAMP